MSTRSQIGFYADKTNTDLFKYKKFENGLADIPTNSTKTSEGDAHIKSLIENFLKSI